MIYIYLQNNNKMAALSRLIFEGTKVAHLGPLNSKKIVVFLHGSGDTGQGKMDF